MPTVIAEFCQNHNGDRGLLKEMIWAAAGAGADYAKIQAIFAEDLAYRERFEEGVIANDVTEVIKRPYRSEFERLSKLEIPYSDYEWFIEECKKAGINPMTTVFCRSQVKEIAKYRWRDVKVASYDCASYPLLRELKGSFNHLFVATGATYDDEIDQAARILGDTSFTFLHCTTIYPGPLDQLHLARMEYLRRFTPSVGFSDHTAVEHGITASAVALSLGADTIERHFTILKPDQTKDGPISINPQQLTQLCTLAHGDSNLLQNYIEHEVGDYRAMIGQSHRDLSPVELLNRDYYRGRFASRDANGSIIYNWEETPLE
ncbi:N-acetylneuraminate synthase family protein [Chloroflexota bacterium]